MHGTTEVAGTVFAWADWTIKEKLDICRETDYFDPEPGK
jgi:hypothetical protein